MVQKLILNSLMFLEESINAELFNQISNFRFDSICNIELIQFRAVRYQKAVSYQNMVKKKMNDPVQVKEKRFIFILPLNKLNKERKRERKGKLRSSRKLKSKKKLRRRRKKSLLKKRLRKKLKQKKLKCKSLKKSIKKLQNKWKQVIFV